MEMMINNVKRKKRKTRRCLDEIRKRAQSFSCRNKSKENKNDLKPGLNNRASNLSNQCITIHRLTLFPKAIQSETVTRPLLLSQKYERRHENIIHTKISSISSPKGFLKKTDVQSSKSNIVKVSLESDEIESAPENKKYKYNESSPDCLNLFSPINNSNDNIRHSPSVSNLSSPNSQDDYGYQLYEEFMNEVPRYLKQSASNFLNKDVMAETRIYLQNLFMGDSPQNSIVYLSSDSSNSSSPEDFLENPKDYIQQQEMFRQDSHNSGADSDSGTNEIVCASPSPRLPASPGNDHTLSIIHVTPEYHFYPHKLN